MVQNGLVGLIVFLAAGYSVWYVLPRAVRQRLGRLHHSLGRAPSCTSSCGSCGKCPGSATSERDATGQAQPVHWHHKR